MNKCMMKQTHPCSPSAGPHVKQLKLVDFISSIIIHRLTVLSVLLDPSVRVLEDNRTTTPDLPIRPAVNHYTRTRPD